MKHITITIAVLTALHTVLWAFVLVPVKTGPDKRVYRTPTNEPAQAWVDRGPYPRPCPDCAIKHRPKACLTAKVAQ